MQAVMILLIHQSTLDSELFFFFIGSQMCTECQAACVEQLELALLSESGIELFLFGWAPLTLMRALYYSSRGAFFCIQTSLNLSPACSLLVCLLQILHTQTGLPNT